MCISHRASWCAPLNARISLVSPPWLAVNIIGSIVGCSDFEEKALLCEWQIVTSGTHWDVVEGEAEGQTHVVEKDVSEGGLRSHRRRQQPVPGGQCRSRGQLWAASDLPRASATTCRLCVLFLVLGWGRCPLYLVPCHVQAGSTPWARADRASSRTAAGLHRRAPPSTGDMTGGGLWRLVAPIRRALFLLFHRGLAATSRAGVAAGRAHAERDMYVLAHTAPAPAPQFE